MGSIQDMIAHTETVYSDQKYTLSVNSGEIARLRKQNEHLERNIALVFLYKDQGIRTHQAVPQNGNQFAH